MREIDLSADFTDSMKTSDELGTEALISRRILLMKTDFVTKILLAAIALGLFAVALRQPATPAYAQSITTAPVALAVDSAHEVLFVTDAEVHTVHAVPYDSGSFAKLSDACNHCRLTCKWREEGAFAPH